MPQRHNRLFLYLIFFILAITISGANVNLIDPTRASGGGSSLTTSGVYVYNSSTTIYFNETTLNNTINNFLTSIYYLPYQAKTIYGTDTGGNNIGNLSYDDNQYYNVSEVSGASPITIKINFTGVTSFNNLDIKEKYDGGSGHEIGVYLWDYVLSEWEIYADITDQSQFYEMSIPIPDYASHISGGLVQMMFNHTSGGKTSHNFYIEYVNLKQSIDTQNIEHDSLSGRDDPNNHPQYYLTNGLRNITGNITKGNLTIYENSTDIVYSCGGKNCCFGNC